MKCFPPVAQEGKFVPLGGVGNPTLIEAMQSLSSRVIPKLVYGAQHPTGDFTGMAAITFPGSLAGWWDAVRVAVCFESRDKGKTAYLQSEKAKGKVRS